MLGETRLQRFQPPDGAANPVREGRAIKFDALPREDLALPVERKMVTVFGDKHMSEQGRGRETLGDRALGGRGLMNGAAASAPVARPADSDDAKPSRHMVEHLADGFADPMQLAAAAGARLVFDIELHLLAGQMSWHARPINEEPAAGRLGCRQR